jgi:hypothetical protein
MGGSIVLPTLTPLAHQSRQARLQAAIGWRAADSRSREHASGRRPLRQAQRLGRPLLRPAALAEAERCYRQGQAISAEVGDHVGEAWSLWTLARVARAAGPAPLVTVWWWVVWTEQPDLDAIDQHAQYLRRGW